MSSDHQKQTVAKPTPEERRPALEVLREAFRRDPKAVRELLGHYVMCNAALADDPYVIVTDNEDTPGVSTLGALGLINGILDACGLPKVAAMCDESDEIVGFCEAVFVSDAKTDDTAADCEEEPRKWYVKDDDGVIHGPYNTRDDAESDADRIDGIVL